MPPDSLLILRDGEAGAPEVTLSPLAYRYQHRAEIEAVVQGTDRDTAFDTLCAGIGMAIAVDRTLGGLCDWVEYEAPRPVDLPIEGAASLKAAVIFAKALARRAVLDWEGIGDAHGKVIAPNPEAIDALLDIWPIFEAFQLAYVSKGLLLEQEKNVSAPSPNGPSAGATATARPARKAAKTARPGRTSR